MKSLFPEFFIEVEKDVSPRDLNQRIIFGLQEYDVFLVQMLKQPITEKFVNFLPVLRDKLGLIQVDMHLLDVVPVKLIPKSLKVVFLALLKKLQQSILKKLDVVVPKVKCKLLVQNGFELRNLVSGLSADYNSLQETFEFVIYEQSIVAFLRYDIALVNRIKVLDKFEQRLGRAYLFAMLQSILKLI